MSSTVFNITFDCADTHRVARFWAAVTGQDARPERLPDGSEQVVVGSGPAPGLPRLVFVQVPEAKAGKNRVHLDIVPEDRSQQEEIDRLAGFGATVVSDRRGDGGQSWVVLADPEGSEFCVERSHHHESEDSL